MPLSGSPYEIGNGIYALFYYLLLGGNNRDTSKYHVISAAIKNMIKEIINKIAVFSGKVFIMSITVIQASSSPKAHTKNLV